jgi:type IV secretory pathway protease TraF
MIRARPSRRSLGIAAAGGVVAFGLVLALHPQAPLAMINESPSLPKGLYRRAFDQSLRPGVVVAMPQPAAARPYLAALGMPPAVRLLKRVAAVGGETVCAAPGWLRWPRGAVRRFAMDRRGVALPRWAGCRVLTSGELLLLGDTAASFDSRYFGPAPKAAVEGVFVETLTW